MITLNIFVFNLLFAFAFIGLIHTIKWWVNYYCAWKSSRSLKKDKRSYRGHFV